MLAHPVVKKAAAATTIVVNLIPDQDRTPRPRKSPIDVGSAFGFRLIQSHRGANERLERLLIDLLAFMDVDGASGTAFQARIEETGGILQRRAFGEGHLHDARISF